MYDSVNEEIGINLFATGAFKFKKWGSSIRIDFGGAILVRAPPIGPSPN